MFIEKIIISGFRSFQNCIIENLSPGQNVFIGSNGSGKSNIILALDFVLTKNYHHLKQSQKNFLICQHKSVLKQSKIKVVEAFVEIHFNNEDKHFPLKEPKIVIKRAITLNSDYYYINGKQTKFNEMMAFLESGGFSLDNPYYLVKQGLISEIAMSNPRYLLDILRSMSGAKSFDEKKSKSIKLNQESEQFIQKVESAIAIIEDNLSMIRIDEANVIKYEKLSKLKNYVVQKIKEQELQQLQRNLRELEQEHQQISEELGSDENNLSDVRNRFEQKQLEQEQIQKKIDSLQNQFESFKKLMETLMKELSDLRRQQQEQEQTLPEEEEGGKILHYDLCEIDSLEKVLEKKSQELNNDIKELFELLKTEKDLDQKLKLLENKRQSYYSLISVVQSSPPSIEQWDQLIKQKYLNILESQLEETRGIVLQYRQNLEELKSEKVSLEKSVKNAVNETKTKLDRLKPLKQEIADLICQNKSQEIHTWEVMNQLNQLQKESISLENDLREVENWLDFHTSEMAITSRRSIETVLESFHAKLFLFDHENEDDWEERFDEERTRMNRIIDGYHGQLVDCFELVKPVNYAMEALMRNNIFYHIVDDETIAVELLNEVSQRELNGSFKFLAINRISESSDYFIEKGLESLYQSLWQCIRNLKPNVLQVELALKSLFKGLFIGRTFETCWSLFQKSQNCDFATLNGELIDRCGVVTKIPLNRPTKFEMYQRYLEHSKRFEEIQKQIKQLELKRDSILKENLNAYQELTLKRQEMFSLQEWFQMRSQNESCQINKSVMVLKQLDQVERQINLVRTSLYANETRMSCLMEERHFWQQKLGQSFSMTEDFKTEIHETFIKDLTEQIDLVQREFHTSSKDRAIKEKKIEDTKSSIYDIKEKLTKLKYFLSNQTSSKEKCKIAELEHEWTNQIETIRAKITDLNSELTSNVQIKSKVENELECLKADMNQVIDRCSLLKKRFQTKQDEFDNLDSQINKTRIDIEQAGLFSNNFLHDLEEPYRNLETPDQMNRVLKNLNIKIKRLIKGGNVNKESLRCYHELREKIDQLVKAKDRQISHLTKVRNLLQMIEHKKNDIVIRTYKQVNMYFQQIFKKFVPHGSACLQFLVSQHQNQSTPSNDGSLESVKSSTNNLSMTSVGSIDLQEQVFLEPVDQFEGIEILVSFQNPTKPDSDLISLSGGQKALVSLVFLLALQQVDPMPFYIFDELDQSLDQTYRNLVAEMIRNQKKQFVITTFRTQLVEQTDKIFFVKNVNGLSQVKCITKEAAIDFLSHISQDNCAK